MSDILINSWTKGVLESGGAPAECKHETTMRAAGIKVCFDCGEPLNAKARVIAGMKAPLSDSLTNGGSSNV
jgi:hypothetical protein